MDVIYVDTIDEEVLIDVKDFRGANIKPRPGTSLAKFLGCPEKEDGRTVDDVDVGRLMRMGCLLT